MSDDLKEWSRLVLEEMKRFDRNHRDVMGELNKIKDDHGNKLGEYNNTLTRLTATVEHHVKRSDLADEERKELKGKIEHIEDEVEGLKEHVDNAKGVVEELDLPLKVFKAVFSIKTLKWFIALLGLISAFFGTKYAVREYKVLKNHTPEYKIKEKK